VTERDGLVVEGRGAVVGGILGGVLTGRAVRLPAQSPAGRPEQLSERKPNCGHGYYLWQGVCYYRYPSGQYAAVDPH
jgi:hypothetical protein